MAQGVQSDSGTVQAVFAELLENMKFANCQQNHDVDQNILRRAPFTDAATCFDTDPASYQATTKRNNFAKYRQGTNIDILEPTVKRPSAYTFDVYLNDYRVLLHEGEYVSYSYNETHAGQQLQVDFDLVQTKPGSILELVKMMK